MLLVLSINYINKRGGYMKIRIKYFNNAKRLIQIEKGNWIDVYSNEDIFIPEGERAMIPLGFALELPEGYEAHLAPRSSTFKTWGIIQTNHVGVIDNSFCGDNDQWYFPAFCLVGKDRMWLSKTVGRKGVFINKGDKIAQFRIIEIQPKIEFEEVEVLGNEDRGMCGTTGTK